jgi:hypothetical protein
VNRFLKTAGCVACLIAILAMLGGHWLALQTVAWARMVVVFSHSDSMGTAIAKTLSGRHPCWMCLKIQEGRHEEQQADQNVPNPKTEIMPELFLEAHRAGIPPAPILALLQKPFAPDSYSDLTESPPTPPPRLSAGVL